MWQFKTEKKLLFYNTGAELNSKLGTDGINLTLKKIELCTNEKVMAYTVGERRKIEAYYKNGQRKKNNK